MGLTAYNRLRRELETKKNDKAMETENKETVKVEKESKKKK